MRTHRRLRMARALGVGVLLTLSALGAGGCAKSKGSIAPNIAPETFVFVQSNNVGTVNHVVKLSWYGSDVDGNVVAFELRLLNPSAPADTAWQRVEAGNRNGYDSTFTIYTPTGSTAPRFEVRSIDDDGLRDPEPATQLFSFSNGQAVVSFTSVPALTDTTIATVTASWQVSDPDGVGAPIFRVWLNSDATQYDSTTARTFTVPSTRFFRDNAYFAGRCTLNVQAIDDGGRLGPVASTVWTTRGPAAVLTNGRGRLLLIDDVPVAGTQNVSIDSIYANTAARNLPPGTFSVLRLEGKQPFRSARDIAQTFRLYEAVVWYRGFENTTQTLFQSYPDSILAYSQQGGRLMIESQYLFFGYGVGGWMNENLVPRYLNNARLALWTQPNPPDSSAGWAVLSGGGRRARSSALGDSIVFAQNSVSIPGDRPGTRAFSVTDTSDVLFWALPDVLSPSNPTQQPIALNVRQPGGGRLIVVTFPMRNAIPLGAQAVTPPSRLVAKMLFHPINGLFAP